MSIIKGALVTMLLISYTLVMVSLTTNYWGIESNINVFKKTNRGLWIECIHEGTNGSLTACGKIKAMKEPEWFNLVKVLMVFSSVSFLAVLVDVFIALVRQGQTLKKLGVLTSIPVTEVFVALITYGSQSSMKLGWSFFVAMGAVPLPIIASTLAYVDGKQSQEALCEDSEENDNEVAGTSGGKEIE